MKKSILIALALFQLGAYAKPTYEPLPPARLTALKKKPCTLIHVWATWCTSCIQELPDVIRVVGSIKGLTPVVIDVSSPFVQQNFSRKWILSLKAPFTMYVKPDIKDDLYLNAIDKDWSGALPYSAIYHKGRRKRVWLGPLDLSAFPREVAELCRDQ